MRNAKLPFTFTVEGSGTFPFDMLRYDACFPKCEGTDSAGLDGHLPRRRVVLVSYAPRGIPTIGRWNSFTWRVAMGEHPDLEAHFPEIMR